MSWFNDGLNSLKGQLTTFAQEVLAEAENKEDEVNPFDALEECKKQNEELIIQCSSKDTEIASLRKQIALLEKNGSLEGSWICEPENLPSEDVSSSGTNGGGKNDNERNSESSSGGEMIAIPLDSQTGATSETESWEKVHKNAEEKDNKLKKLLQENKNLKHKLLQLTTDNQELTENLDTLDSQHNVAIQELLDIKNELQNKLVNLNADYELLKVEHEKTIYDGNKDLENLKIKLENRYENEVDLLHENIKTLEEQCKNLKTACEAKDQNLFELLNKTNEYENEMKKRDLQYEDQIMKLQSQIDLLNEQLEKSSEYEKSKHLQQERKADDLSSSISKQGSEDEFIVLQNENDIQSTENWEKRYQDSEKEKLNLQEKLNLLEEDLRKVETEKNNILEMYEFDLNLKDKTIVGLKTTSEKIMERAMELENEMAEIKNERDNLKKQIENNEDELNKSNDKLNDYENKIKILKEQENLISSLQHSVKSLEQEKCDLMKKIEIVQSQFNEHTAAPLKVELETQFNEIKNINEDLKMQIEEQKQKISELNNSVEICEANASDVETKLMMENVDLQKRIIDMESLKNEQKTETVIVDLQKTALYYDRIQNLLSTYLQIEIDSKNDDRISIEEFLKNVQSKLLHLNNLENKFNQITDEMSKLKSEKSAIEHEKKTLQADIMHYEEECDELMKNNEILLNELENLRKNKLETISEKDEECIAMLEKQLEECNNVNKTLDSEFNRVHERIEEIENEKHELSSKLKNLQEINENLEKSLKNLKQENQLMEEETCRLIFEINEMKTDDKKSAMESEILEFKTTNKNLEKQLERLSKDHSDLVAALQSQQVAFIEYKKENEIAIKNYNKEVKEKDVLIKIKENELEDLKRKIEVLEAELTKQTSKENVENEVENLKSKIIELNNKNQELEENLKGMKVEESKEVQKYLSEKSENDEKSLKLDKFQKEIIEYQKTIKILTNEKENLIQAITSKHNENVQYYEEIQRLDQLLKQELENSAKKQQEKERNCENCISLQNNLSEIKTSHYDEIEKLKDQINFLKEKSNILTTNLLTEQTNQKLLQQEKSELIEQNNNLSKDLERLRQHLVELEESHTQEAIEMQNIIEETKAKMSELQKEAANSSNAYTSASIRANQHAETLQVQYQLVSQQRDELALKLSKAEDRESKSQAALINLQCALEQFQKEKEKDVLLATNRIRKELQNERDKQLQLQSEIKSLNQQLAEANQGLLAATRLSNQLEASQMTITSLNEQIAKLESINQSLKEKFQSNELNQADKIEKSLVKSLIIGYIVSTNQNDKSQILKMISSILDFDQIEINKVGLNKTTQSGWLTGILHSNDFTPETNSRNTDGLVKAFVDFLEKESQPRVDSAKMPNLLNIVSSDHNISPLSKTSVEGSSSNNNKNSNERKISIDRLSTSSSTSSTTVQHQHYHHIQPILLNESVLEQFGPTRNSSSILKDILNDT